MLLAVAFAALGRAIPGTHRAIRELAFQLERDADRWALQQRNDRLALASVMQDGSRRADRPSRACQARQHRHTGAR